MMNADSIVGQSVSPTAFADSDLIAIDGACAGDYWQANALKFHQGGFTGQLVTVNGSEVMAPTMQRFESLGAFINRNAGKLSVAMSIDQILEAKRSGKLAAIYHFQGADPLEADIGWAEIYWRLGLRVLQLSDNRSNCWVGGCLEDGDEGLSRLGKLLIPELNRLGIVVDGSQTAERSVLEACELSSAPIILSHSNPAAICKSRRNVSDGLIRAVAQSGGTIGMNAVPYFVSTDGAAAFETFLDMFKHVANLVGTEHIALGLDYRYRDIGPTSYAQLLSDGRWDKETYPQPPPWSYPDNLDDESGALPRLIEGLRRGGFNTVEIRDIMGGNLMRVFTQAWKPAARTAPPPRPEADAAKDFHIAISTADAVRREPGQPEGKERRQGASGENGRHATDEFEHAHDRHSTDQLEEEQDQHLSERRDDAGAERIGDIPQGKPAMNLLMKFALLIVLVLGAGLLIGGKVWHDFLQREARDQVLGQAQLMIQAATAMRTYTEKQIQPLVGVRRESDFHPQWVPFYAATQLFKYLSVNYPDYRYKEAALNPMNQRDRAVEWEADVINYFRDNPDKTEFPENATA